ncbi:hypothetical protein [Flexithrix dorotheae]|uniref:hypothetical protein n=1 Tax=Flexithrix dorotheae TaxID=70993 RepID=UPI0003662304|nr:hypothetical protein [Flexithrix dorotheae]
MKFLLILFAILSLNIKNTDTPISNSEVGIQKGHSKSNFEKTSDNSDFIRTTLYKGTLNETVNISLYINEQDHPCGGNLTILNAMYKYDNQEKWILLNVTTDKQKKKYCMIEDNFTGSLFLEEDGNFLNGKWISPNTEKQFKIELKKVELDNSSVENLDEILFDDLLYNKNDC